MKRKISAVLVTVLILCFSLSAYALEPSERFYANDTSGILSADTEDYICQENYRLYDQCSGAELVVVTANFLDGYTPEEYAYTVFNDWALGDADENNGVLILLSPGEEKYWVTPGTGIASFLTPGRLDTILAENMEPYFAAEDYDKAAMNTFKAITDEINSYYGISQDEVEAWYTGQSYGDGYYEDESTSISPGRIILAVFILVIVISLANSFFSIGRRRRYGVYTPPSTTRTYIPRRSFRSSSYGSSGRAYRPSGRSTFGSSSHRSSFGGSSHRSSGGGRRGGGGASRGGGAGRR